MSEGVKISGEKEKEKKREKESTIQRHPTGVMKKIMNKMSLRITNHN